MQYVVVRGIGPGSGPPPLLVLYFSWKQQIRIITLKSSFNKICKNKIQTDINFVNLRGCFNLLLVLFKKIHFAHPANNNEPVPRCMCRSLGSKIILGRLETWRSYSWEKSFVGYSSVLKLKTTGMRVAFYIHILYDVIF